MTCFLSHIGLWHCPGSDDIRSSCRIPCLYHPQMEFERELTGIACVSQMWQWPLCRELHRNGQWAYIRIGQCAPSKRKMGTSLVDGQKWYSKRTVNKKPVVLLVVAKTKQKKTNQNKCYSNSSKSNEIRCFPHGCSWLRRVQLGFFKFIQLFK